MEFWQGASAFRSRPIPCSILTKGKSENEIQEIRTAYTASDVERYTEWFIRRRLVNHYKSRSNLPTKT
jgi:hypothetical protein